MIWSNWSSKSGKLTQESRVLHPFKMRARQEFILTWKSLTKYIFGWAEFFSFIFQSTYQNVENELIGKVASKILFIVITALISGILFVWLIFNWAHNFQITYFYPRSSRIYPHEWMKAMMSLHFCVFSKLLPFMSENERQIRKVSI